MSSTALASGVLLFRAEDRARTRHTMTASVILHAVVLALLVLYQRLTPPPELLTEITWMDSELPGPAGAPAPAPPPAAGVGAPADPVQPTAPAPKALFQRPTPVGELAGEPQDAHALGDQLSERLASLRETAAQSRVAPLEMETPRSLWKSNPAVPGTGSVKGLGPGGTGVALTRGGVPGGVEGGIPGGILGDTGGSNLPLTRAGMGVGGDGYAAGLAVAGAGAGKRAAGAPVREGAANASRTLANALLIGPVADRPVLEYAKPAFPEWAQHEAVEASVTLYFIVLPNGKVKENIMVEKTSGYEDFDHNAQSALLAWHFAPLSGSAAGEQWGTITFHFRLRDAQG